MEEDKSKSNGGMIIGVIIAIVVIAGVVYYFQSRPQAPQAMAPGAATPVAGGNGTDYTPSDTMSTTTEVKTFDLIARNYSFTPNEIRVKTGDKVKINLTSEQGFHDWTIDEFKAATSRINTGETASVEFTADRPGTFEFYCSVGNHRQLGMVGNLIVE